MARPGARRALDVGRPAVVPASSPTLHPARRTRASARAGVRRDLLRQGRVHALAPRLRGRRGRPTRTTSFNAGHPEIYLDRPVLRRAPAARQVDHRARPRRVRRRRPASAGASRSRVVGILLVVVTMLIAHRLFRSTLLDRHRGRSARDRRQRDRAQPGGAARQRPRPVRAARGRLRAARPHAGRATPARLARRPRASPARPTDWGPVFWWRPVAARRRGSRSGSRAASSGTASTSSPSSPSTRWCRMSSCAAARASRSG